MKKLDLPYELPPYHYLLQIADHCPKAVGLYIRLWNERDKYNSLTVEKWCVREKYSSTLAKFRHDLFLLSKEGLASYMENFDEIAIELIEWSAEDENC